MGCLPSTPAEKPEPPEDIPSYESLVKTKIEHLEGEPELTSGQDNYTSDEALLMIIRQIGSSGKGGVFQVETMHDALFHNLQIHPATTGINIKGSLEDLVFLHYENSQDPLAFAMKNVPKGLNYYLVLSPEPLRKDQPAVKFEGPSNCKEMYFYAGVEFDIQAKVCHVGVAGQGKDDPPLYSMKQLNKKVWIIKKQHTVCAAVQQVQGIAKLTCFRALYCAGTDPAFMSLLVTVIDSFLAVAQTQKWRFYEKNDEAPIDWPPLSPEMQDKLFGHKCKFW